MNLNTDMDRSVLLQSSPRGTEKQNTVEFYDLEFAKYDSNAFADLLVISETMSKSRVVVLGNVFYCPNQPLLSQKQALWESHIPGHLQIIMEDSR